MGRSHVLWQVRQKILYQMNMKNILLCIFGAFVFEPTSFSVSGVNKIFHWNIIHAVGAGGEVGRKVPFFFEHSNALQQCESWGI